MLDKTNKQQTKQQTKKLTNKIKDIYSLFIPECRGSFSRWDFPKTSLDIIIKDAAQYFCTADLKIFKNKQK